MFSTNFAENKEEILMRYNYCDFKTLKNAILKLPKKW